jgi:hypothetical protein
MKTLKPLLLLLLFQYQILFASCQETQTLSPLETLAQTTLKSIKTDGHTPDNVSSYPMDQESQSRSNRPLSKLKSSDDSISSSTLDITIFCIIAGLLSVGICILIKYASLKPLCNIFQQQIQTK